MQVDLVIAIILAAALALIVGMVSRFLTISGLKKNAESKIGNAEAKAREIIDDAVKTAETTKKEALLEVKEESIKTKNDLEKETKERRAELQRYEKRVLAKEEAVDKRSDVLEHRESKLTAKEDQLRQREAKVEELNQKRVQELERISGLTSEQAKDLSTPLNWLVISSNCFNLLVYVSIVSRLAPGLAAEIVSAACTTHAINVCGSTSP